MKSFFQKTFLLIVIIISISNQINSQSSETCIKLINPSFEENPTCCRTPSGWVDCGFKNQTPPDIQPAKEGEEPLFGVTTKAFDGQTYLGMVTRSDGTYERVSHKLSMPLKKGKCYRFTIYLCTSKEYKSATNKDPNISMSYTTPIKLRISAGRAYCHIGQVLSESKEIVNSEWKKYTFEFIPDFDYEIIDLAATFINEKNPVNGNILLDNASDIELIPCE